MLIYNAKIEQITEKSYSIYVARLAIERWRGVGLFVVSTDEYVSLFPYSFITYILKWCYECSANSPITISKLVPKTIIKLYEW